jgi:hypothetical protein
MHFNPNDRAALDDAGHHARRAADALSAVNTGGMPLHLAAELAQASGALHELAERLAQLRAAARRPGIGDRV